MAVAVVVGRLGPPTTTSRPSAVRSTSIGAPYSSLSSGGCDHLFDRTRKRAAVDDVDHAVDVGEQRVDVVGDEQHRDLLGAGRSA